MALTKDEKNQVIAEVNELLSSSKLTVIAKYQGTTVKALQNLRRDARQNGTKLKVVKNRLVKKALEQNDTFKGIDTAPFEGMLLYAFNSEDEVAPVQSLNDFAKTNPSIQFVGALTADGKFMPADDVKALAGLPSKPQLLAQVIATLLSPVTDITSGLSGNLHGLLDAIGEKAA